MFSSSIFCTREHVVFPWYADPSFQIAVFPLDKAECYQPERYSLLSHIPANNHVYTYIYFSLSTHDRREGNSGMTLLVHTPNPHLLE